jgi:hypothetical protein
MFSVLRTPAGTDPEHNPGASIAAAPYNEAN